jgi:hypothetical protein
MKVISTKKAWRKLCRTKLLWQAEALQKQSGKNHHKVRERH